MVAIIAVVVAIKVVIVFAAAVIAVPIAIEEALAVMVRSHPAGADIRRPGPISGMPFIVPAYGIPVACHPDEPRAGTCHNPLHPQGRRRADGDSDRNLA